MLSKVNHDLLSDIYCNQCFVVQLDKNQIRGVKAIVRAFKGYIDGLSFGAIAMMLQEIQNRKVENIFVDGSNYGEFIRVIKKNCPRVQIYTFFHNVEARFFLGALRQNMTLHALAVLIVNYLAEKKSVRYSDKLICLNKEDSHLLQRIYGRAETHVSALALQDKLPGVTPSRAREPGEKFALFVGGLFYANRAGIAWFVENVAPRIQIKICIVGRGFEGLKRELELARNVEVIGAVDSLVHWYHNAHFVIAPIFDGSGMKTKVAEALMFGKKIIGTPEAFAGYEEISHRAGRVCRSADEFVAAIESADEMVSGSFDPGLRAIYEEKYSYPAARLRLEEIVASVR